MRYAPQAQPSIFCTYFSFLYSYIYFLIYTFFFMLSTWCTYFEHFESYPRHFYIYQYILYYTCSPLGTHFEYSELHRQASGLENTIYILHISFHFIFIFIKIFYITHAHQLVHTLNTLNCTATPAGQKRDIFCITFHFIFTFINIFYVTQRASKGSRSIFSSSNSILYVLSQFQIGLCAQ